jgi:4-amino-4-deoxy-L-arabinose transferase-like glycosyltransferase
VVRGLGTAATPRAASRRLMMRAATRKRAAIAVVLAALFVLWFAQIEHRQLLEPDEGRYAEIPREMLTTGDWITPRLNDLLYFEKPPLQYWSTAAAYAAFGPHNWTARLWCVLTGLAGIALAFYAARRLHSMKAAIYAAAMLGSSVLYFGASHVNTLDAGVTFFLEATVFGLVLSRRSCATPLEARLSLGAAWVAMALAVLSKGLIGIVLPALAFALYSALYRDNETWRKLDAKIGIPLMLAIAAPWFVAVTRAHPDFPYFFFVHEHFTRFLTTEHHRYEPWWFFLPVLLLGTLPWTPPMLKSLARPLQPPPRGESFHASGFLAVWIAVVFMFFSASHSKLIAYILPLFPPLALLAGIRLAEMQTAEAARELIASATAAVVVFAAGLLVLAFAATRHPEMLHVAYVTWLAAGITLWGLAAAVATVGLRKRKLALGFATLAIAAVGTSQLALTAVDALGPARSTYGLARQIRPYLANDTEVYAVQLYPQALPFYLGRTLTLVDYRGELAFGLAREPHRGIATLDEFEQRWKTGHDAIAVMAKETFDAFQSARLPMAVIATDARRVAVRKP